jgi:hypothetical protein
LGMCGVNISPTPVFLLNLFRPFNHTTFLKFN